MRTRILASITLWLAAVVSIASIAWLAIDAAGRQVTASPVVASLPNHTPAKGSRPAPSRTSDPDPSQTSQTSQGSQSQDPPPGAAAGTYATTGGRVRVNCQENDITLDGGYAQPASGWSVLVRSAGPAQVQVVFELSNQQALLVVATCVAGHPQFDQDRIEGD